MHDFVVPDDCVWDTVAHTTELKLGTALNDAMRAIERAYEPKFDGILANSTVDFNAQDRLPRSKLVTIINHFGSLPLDRASVHDDLFGNAYEYLIRNFASKAGKSSGEFYTPREVAYLMAEIVEPQPQQQSATGLPGLAGCCCNAEITWNVISARRRLSASSCTCRKTIPRQRIFRGSTCFCMGLAVFAKRLLSTAYEPPTSEKVRRGGYASLTAS